MFVFGNLVNAIALVIHSVLTLYMWIVIIAALITWVNPDPYNPIVRFLFAVTEPVFRMVRKALPFSAMGGIDFTPIIVLLAIMFLDSFLVPTLMKIGADMNAVPASPR